VLTAHRYLTKEAPIDTSFIAAAGEHYVLAQLFLHGMLASLAPRNAKDLDILVLDNKETIVAAVQVKARRVGADGGWPMRPHHASLVRARLFYVLVDFAPAVPTTCIVPSKVVADVLTKSHAAWLKALGRKGQPHNDTTLRRLVPNFKNFTVPDYQDGWLCPYLDRWDLLRPSTQDSAPVESPSSPLVGT
jgi:hypothetical protein